MTVSRVINGKKNVKASTRARVEAAIRDLSYSPNPAATSLARDDLIRIGLLYGNPSQLITQLIAVVVVAAYSAAITWVLLKVIDAVIGIRVSPEEEQRGLDTTQHGEAAYQL